MVTPNFYWTLVIELTWETDSGQDLCGNSIGSGFVILHLLTDENKYQVDRSCAFQDSAAKSQSENTGPTDSRIQWEAPIKHSPYHIICMYRASAPKTSTTTHTASGREGIYSKIAWTKAPKAQLLADKAYTRNTRLEYSV